MDINQIKILEDCYDGSISREFVFDTAVTKDFINYLSQKGKMNYYSSFAKPFYKIVSLDGILTLKGIEGALTLKITIKNKNSELLLDELISFIKSYDF